MGKNGKRRKAKNAAFKFKSTLGSRRKLVVEFVESSIAQCSQCANWTVQIAAHGTSPFLREGRVKNGSNYCSLFHLQSNGRYFAVDRNENSSLNVCLLGFELTYSWVFFGLLSRWQYIKKFVADNYFHL